MGENTVDVVATELVDKDEALQQLEYHLQKAKEQMKICVDKTRLDYSFEVWVWVFLKLRFHRQSIVEKRINQKLEARYFVPFLIVEKLGVVSYKLKLSNFARAHFVFHISQLKRAIWNYTA